MAAMIKLSEREESQIRERAGQVETRTGVQVLAVVTGKSDTYPEVPWRAFSLGAALATLSIATAPLLGIGGFTRSPLLWATAPLGVGMVLAVATIFLQPAARLFLGEARTVGETRQFAQSLFLERNLGRTRSRTAVLVLVSQFERRAAVVADQGVLDRVPTTEIDLISAAMDTTLARTTASIALADGLAALEETLRRHGFAAAERGDEIEDEFLETEGPNS
jgi:putative membrane protein